MPYRRIGEKLSIINSREGAAVVRLKSYRVSVQTDIVVGGFDFAMRAV